MPFPWVLALNEIHELGLEFGSPIPFLGGEPLR